MRFKPVYASASGCEHFAEIGLQLSKFGQCDRYLEH